MKASLARVDNGGGCRTPTTNVAKMLHVRIRESITATDLIAELRISADGWNRNDTTVVLQAIYPVFTLVRTVP